MTIRIVTDSTCDLPVDLVQELGITVVPLKVLFGEEVYTEGLDITNEQFYKKMSEHRELPKTAQVNPSEFIQVFKKYLDDGDEVLGIFISYKLSGTYSSAVLAKDELADSRIHLIDSESVTFGLGLLVYEAARRVIQGQSIEEIVQFVESAKLNIAFYGVIDNLENLKKGGRLTTTAAIAGSLLGIKPIITIKDGSVVIAGKSRGLKKALSWVLDDGKKNNIDFNSGTVFLANAADPANMAELKSMLLKEYTPVRIIECEIGSVVGTHAGAGCVGISCLK